MKIMVSACLIGENCKYNGGNNMHEGVLKLIAGHEVIAVCPEVMGGLPIPRIPCEIRDGKVINREGESKDKEFREGAHKALEIAITEKIDYAILKSKSPSCGAKGIYDGTFNRCLVSGRGVFAELLNKQGFKVIDSEDVI